MQTGYDSYWMQNNCRPQHVPNPTKNDSFYHLVYTDSYKQVQGPGGPTAMYHYIPSQNNTARPQKALNDQLRVASSQNMWPPTAYSQTFRSSQKQNLHQKEAFPGQANNVCQISQPLPNHNLSHLSNCNVSYPQVQNVNYTGSTNSQINETGKTQIARIKVKDVYSLNNNAPQGSLLSSMLQGPPKKQQCCSYNSAMGKPRQMFNSESQREYINCDNVPLPNMNHSYHHFGPSGRHPSLLNNNQQYADPSGPYFQQNAQFSCDTQLHFNNVQQIREKPLMGVISNKSVSQESNVQKAQMDSSESTKKRNSFELNISFNSERSPYSHAAANTNNSFQFHHSETGLIQPPRLSPISPASESSNSLLHNTTNHTFNGIKPQAPNTAQKAFPARENSGCGEQNRKDPRRASFSQEARAPEICQGDEASNLSSPRLTEPFETTEGNRSNENPPQEVEANGGLVTPKLEKDEDSDSLEVGQEVSVRKVIGKLIKREQRMQPSEGEFPEKEGQGKKKKNAEEAQARVCARSRAEVKEKEAEEVEDEVKEEEEEEKDEEYKKELEIVEERKYKSKINRSKLNMLINFLKNEENPYEKRKRKDRHHSSVFKKSKRESSFRKLRKKLSKTGNSKHRHNEKEKNFHKTGKFPSKRSTNNKKPEEVRESGSSDNSNFSENMARHILKTELGDEYEDEEGSSEPKSDSRTSSEASKPEAKSSSLERADTPEERQIINVMRAFQKRKDHFCANCNFSSPVESIWINVVSGELRCLHCFKKMMSKSEESVPRSDGSGVKKLESLRKNEKEESRRKEEGGKDACDKDIEKTWKSDSENSNSSVEYLKKDMPEESEIDCEKMEEGEGEGEEGMEEKNEKTKQKGRSDKPVKISSSSKFSEERSEALKWKSKPFETIKKDKTVTKKAKEDHDSSKRRTPDDQRKPEVNYKTEKLKNSGSKEQKVESFEKSKRKEASSPELSRKRSASSEERVPQKVRVVEEAAKDGKQWKTGSEEKRGYKCVLKECSERSEGREKKEEAEKQSKEGRKEVRREEETKRRVSWSSEEMPRLHVRKRLSLDEGKTEEAKREGKRSPEKPKVRREPKEGLPREPDVLGQTEEAIKSRQEEFYNVNVHEELAKKEAKLMDLLEKIKKKTNLSEKIICAEVSRRKSTSKEEERTKKKNDGCDVHVKPVLTKDPRAKQESSRPEKTDRKERHSLDKTGKTFHSKVVSGTETLKKFFEGFHGGRSSVSPKEKENSRVSPNGKHKQREGSCNCWQPGGEKKAEEGGRRQERSGKESPLWLHDRRDKTTECNFGKVVKDTTKNAGSGRPDSGALLARLRKKTKSLSWTLLEETLGTPPTEKEVYT